MSLGSGLRELIAYRELAQNLVVRDLKARYKNSVIGFLWSLVNPLLMMVVLTIVFTLFLRNQAIEHFPVFVLTGILAWNLHATAVTAATGSVVNNAHLVTKVYFPRALLPIASVLSNAVNFLLALVVLLAFILVGGLSLSWTVIYLPLVLLIQIVFTVGVGFLLATVNVFFRDTQHILETLLLGWFFLTPVFYRAEDLFPAYARLTYWLNPVASFVSSYRIVLFHGVAPDPLFLLRSLGTALLALAVGYAVFVRYSARFAEEL